MSPSRVVSRTPDLFGNVACITKLRNFTNLWHEDNNPIRVSIFGQVRDNAVTKLRTVFLAPFTSRTSASLDTGVRIPILPSSTPKTPFKRSTWLPRAEYQRISHCTSLSLSLASAVHVKVSWIGQDINGRLGLGRRSLAERKDHSPHDLTFRLGFAE